MAKTFFSLVDVVNVYGDKNFLSGVHKHTHKKNIKSQKKINKNTKAKGEGHTILLIFWMNSALEMMKEPRDDNDVGGGCLSRSLDLLFHFYYYNTSISNFVFPEAFRSKSMQADKLCFLPCQKLTVLSYTTCWWRGSKPFVP